MTSQKTRTIDFIGTTYSIRFGETNSGPTGPPVRLSKRPLDLADATDLPAYRNLSQLGVEFYAFVGCPMVRAFNVPSGPAAERLVREAAEQFAWPPMRDVVEDSCELNSFELGVDDNDVLRFCLGMERLASVCIDIGS
jgi:hypothetical protein